VQPRSVTHCAEWESKEALHEHLKSEHFMEFCKFIHESNIPMKLAMAIPVESMEIFE
jgi:quinol monooxygenase YgiN